MTDKKFRIKYSHSKFWLIFWILIYFPIGLVLLLSHAEIISSDRTLKMKYDGSRFWLFFWALIFFPVVLLLFLFNGTFVAHHG
jgi:hypothetical protein